MDNGIFLIPNFFRTQKVSGPKNFPDPKLFPTKKVYGPKIFPHKNFFSDPKFRPQTGQQFSKMANNGQKNDLINPKTAKVLGNLN